MLCLLCTPSILASKNGFESFSGLDAIVLDIEAFQDSDQYIAPSDTICTTEQNHDQNLYYDRAVHYLNRILLFYLQLATNLVYKTTIFYLNSQNNKQEVL